MSKSIHLWGDGSSINNGENVGCGGCGYTLLFGDFGKVCDEDGKVKEVFKTKYCEDDKFMLTGWEASKEHTTNQREEIKAIIYGLKRIKNYELPIEVFSDSAYLVNCMNDKWHINWRNNGWKNSSKKPVENQDLWEELLEIVEDNFLNIRWNKVKGHSKIYYNEQCDKLAGKGLDKARYGE